MISNKVLKEYSNKEKRNKINKREKRILDYYLTGYGI